jgi:hypothetical protein
MFGGVVRFPFRAQVPKAEVVGPGPGADLRGARSEDRLYQVVFCGYRETN